MIDAFDTFRENQGTDKLNWVTVAKTIMRAVTRIGAYHFNKSAKVLYFTDKNGIKQTLGTYKNPKAAARKHFNEWR